MANPPLPLTIEKINEFTFPQENPAKKDIAMLHAAFRKLKLDVAPEEMSRNEMGESTKAAIRTFQQKVGLRPDGKLSPNAVKRLKGELEHSYYAASKTRTERIHELLARLGHEIDAAEKKSRMFGKSTEKALRAFQAKLRLPADGRLSETIVKRLNDEALKARLASKTQVGRLHLDLLRAVRIAKLRVNIDPNELKQKNLGPTTQAAVSAFQQKYGLTQTGNINPETYERIRSVAESRPTPVKTLKVKSATNLSPLGCNLRLNMASKEVGDLQQVLAFFGFRIDEKEYKTREFGRTTREAVIAYQRGCGIPATGHAEGPTLAALNQEIREANPKALNLEYPYRIKGSVRDELWKGKTGLKVQVWEKTLRGEGELLSERKTLSNGFLDVPYDPPRNRVDGTIRSPFHLKVRILAQDNHELATKVLFNPTPIAWINFTDGSEPYRGVSEYEKQLKAVSMVVKDIPLVEIEESAERREITHIALRSGLSQEDVMRLVLSHLAARILNRPEIDPEICYAFIRQNLPPGLPDDLIGSTDQWTRIEELVDETLKGLVFMERDLQEEALKNAARKNLIPVSAVRQKDEIITLLSSLKQDFALKRPILIGKCSLESLLESSKVNPESYAEAAGLFLRHNGFSSSFWAEMNERADQFGGDAAIRDLETAVNIGHIAGNHLPTVSFLKTRLSNTREVRINRAQDLAKLTHDEWVGLINENQGRVPEDVEGATPEERISSYAHALALRSEQLFPGIAFVAEIGRSNRHNLTRLAEIQQLLDTHADLDLRSVSIDEFNHERELALDQEMLSQTRVMQRVHRISPTAAAGRVLVEERIHSSAQIVAMGKEKLVKIFQNQGIEDRIALTIYGYAEFQYAQVLARIADYRFELHRADPRAIIRHTYTTEEQEEALGGIPNLETLFGSLDFCECPHCRSVYSPSAYLADLLRFLGNHDSEQAGKTVRDILFERRPDLARIKLNCENTDTALPYIDLVCEVLENAVPAPDTNPGFSFQTTRTGEELKAFPENIRNQAYNLLKDADYPMNSSLNLWQEEARTFLQHLDIKCHRFMKEMQARPAGRSPYPSELSIAGEFWDMPSHETEIVSNRAASTSRQNEFWGFDCTRSRVPVSDFLAHAKIDYKNVLELLYVKWFNPSEAERLAIERPLDCADTGRQDLINLTVDRFDRIHRFLRLWRRTGWKMWELDLLIRAANIGNNKIDRFTIIRLKELKEVQDRLGLAFEQALSLYNQINTEHRVHPDQPEKQIDALYTVLFRNPAVTNPVNENFALPLPGGERLSDHKATLSAALAVSEQDLDLLISKTNNRLNLSNLSRIYNHTVLARGLRMSIRDSFALQDLSGIGNPLSSPNHTLEFIEHHDWIKRSGFAVQELDYILNYLPDSPYGLREEVITQYVGVLRESLRGISADQKRGQIVSQVGSSLGVTDEQAGLLLDRLSIGSSLIDHLNDSRLTEKDPDDRYVTEITPGNFPQIYDSYRLLHKASMLLKRHRITSREDLDWLLTRFGVCHSLDFSALPVSAGPAAPLFPAWLVLYKWLFFQSQYAEPEGTSLRQVFDLAADPSTHPTVLLNAISTLTNWKVEDLQSFHSGWQLRTASDYTNVDIYIRLWKAFGHVKRTGVGAQMLLDWAERDNDSREAQFERSRQIRQAVKSKYDYNTWLSKVAPLQDELRERKRSALVDYLVEHSLRTESKEILFKGRRFANPKYWKDANDLLSYFLIDVEMSACQLTSRIKQAMSSVQMFVQRCFLNLEQPYVEVSREEREDTVSLNSWKQWKWMKSYRIWEANRKVFLYPENWIEPELRDDKSPFFVELENEIMQNEITDQNAEAAFLHYLQKVHEVSRLDVAGVYHEIDDASPYDDLPPAINVLHVVGRTKSQPGSYYYRRFDLNYNTWTAWEEIDLDITGDHVIPVVYNRKLYLFWLVFTEKHQQVKKQPPAMPSDKPSDAPETRKMLEIQIAWSVRNDRGWSPKRTSPHRLIHPWERPLSTYNLKPRYKKRENLLWLDVHVSTSIQFNNSMFYDPFTNTRKYLTGFKYDENARPWHSSSFIFDGEVVDVKLKGLGGQYSILDANDILSEDLVLTDSYRYVHDNFGKEAPTINKLEGKYEIAPRLVLPDGMHYHYTRLANNKRNLNSSRLNILEYESTKTLLQGARSPFEIVFSQDQTGFDTLSRGEVPFLYQDGTRAFFIKMERQEILDGPQTEPLFKYVFYPFYHPYTALFIRELNRSGLEGLLNRKLQLYPQSCYPGNSFSFASYLPSPLSAPDKTAERDKVDFSPYGAFSIYNWEAFFHAPLMIACKLSRNQRFEEAMRWFHYIFDPTNTEALGVPQRYWVTRPFFEQNSEDYRRQRIEKLLENIGENQDQIRAWKNNPFKPHLIARFRPVAYQKAVVMKYIDNLIAWGDQLFRRDTMESINEATMLYVLAYELLGPRPLKIPNVGHRDLTYNELTADGDLDPFGNRRVEILMENFTDAPVRVVPTDEGSEPLPMLDIFYFGIPDNDKLLEYWNTVEDRLFKIRHGMNIEGTVRRLPLFEPPIDPALLVKAAAAGVDLSSVLCDIALPQGQYRFTVLAQKALEFCSEVKALGEKLLSVLEKKDAEELALLRSIHEITLLEAVKEVRKEQIEEAVETLESLSRGMEVLEKKVEYYGSIPYMNGPEIGGLVLHFSATMSDFIATVAHAVSGTAHLVPRVDGGGAGFGGSPTLTTGYGGENAGRSGESYANLFHGIAAILHADAQMLETQGGYMRRNDENRFQKEMAEKEKTQLERQIEAARIRCAMAERELANHELQIEQAEVAEEYLRSKYTNRELYEWMIGQLSTVYFQSYQLAYDMAKRAEKCFQFELGKPEASFVQFGYWDSLKKGLLSGEKLAHDIRRMESAWYDQHKRELELTKHVSLAQVAPMSLLMLKETGECSAVLPEWLFDMDYPGHYRRRIKSVSVTIPAVVGPYTGINCTLSLTNNGIRMTDETAAGYGDPLTASDTRFVRNAVPIQSIATSHGQNDSGVFELSFRDERYLPFEGAGAVSEWQISLPRESNRFDFATISDVILHIRYTAAAGNTGLVTAARENLNTALPQNGYRLLDLRQEFGSEWHRLFHPTGDADQEMVFNLRTEHLPFYARNRNAVISRIDLIVESTHDGSFDVRLQIPGADSPTDEFMTADPAFGGMHHMEKTVAFPTAPVTGSWRIQIKKSSDPDYRSLLASDIRNAYLVIRFSI